VSAELAERDAEHAALIGDDTRTRASRQAAGQARQAAERGRRSARRLHMRRQARALLGPPRWWGVLLSARREAAFPTFEVAVIGTDLAGTVRLWNEAAERLYGWRREDALDRPVGDLTVGPDDARVAERIMARVLETGAWEGEFWVRRADGTRFLAYVLDAVVFDRDGRPAGIVGVSIDVAPGLRPADAGVATVRVSPAGTAG
jgi:PAS domain S-box-containing protein